MSRTRVNWRRVQMALAGVRRAKRRFDAIKVRRWGWGVGGVGGGAAGPGNC